MKKLNVQKNPESYQFQQEVFIYNIYFNTTQYECKTKEDKKLIYKLS